MQFNSLEFILFFACFFVIYYSIPKQWRYIWILAGSYFFYTYINTKFVIVLFAETIITYSSAILISKSNTKKVALWGGITLCLCTLGYFKYYLFIQENIGTILGFWGHKVTFDSFNIILPLGISFFTLQAIGYLIDVYRGVSQPEWNLLKYAAFISFFPTIVSGPIERSNNLLKQLQNGTDFLYEKVKHGLLLICLGYFEKYLIANRLAVIIDRVFDNYSEQTGAVLLFALVLYAIQIYADFSGYSYIAIGISKMLGYDLLENFRQPYFSLNIKEFWRRWHISLSHWLRDYIYIPLGGSRNGNYKYMRNLLLVFGLSGLWHGADWHYIVWGILHGIYQIVGYITERYRKTFVCKLKIKTDCFSYRLLQRMITFVLVDFAWLFFRVGSVRQAFDIVYQILSNFQFDLSVSQGWLLLGIDGLRTGILYVEILILFIIDILHEKKSTF